MTGPARPRLRGSSGFGREMVVLALDHPDYSEGATLTEETRTSLGEDLEGV